jgi:hypothetical protein
MRLPTPVQATDGCLNQRDAGQALDEGSQVKKIEAAHLDLDSNDWTSDRIARLRGALVELASPEVARYQPLASHDTKRPVGMPSRSPASPMRILTFKALRPSRRR